jgi:hypothetical protein
MAEITPGVRLSLTSTGKMEMQIMPIRRARRGFVMSVSRISAKVWNCAQPKPTFSYFAALEFNHPKQACFYFNKTPGKKPEKVAHPNIFVRSRQGRETDVRERKKL